MCINCPIYIICISIVNVLAPLVDPVIYRWIADWLSDRSIALTIDGIQSPRQESRCGIPHGSPLSPVLFGLVCATALKDLPPGANHVDDCSWQYNLPRLVSFNAKLENF
jgi:hypothetical protein